MIRKNFPLQSDYLNDRLDEAFGKLVSLIGYISPSGTVDAQGIYDAIDGNLSDHALTLVKGSEERSPSVLQMIEEFDRTRSHDPTGVTTK